MTFYDIIYGDPYSDNFCLDTVNDMFKNESDYSDSESSDYESCYFWAESMGVPDEFSDDGYMSIPIHSQRPGTQAYSARNTISSGPMSAFKEVSTNTMRLARTRQFQTQRKQSQLIDIPSSVDEHQNYWEDDSHKKYSIKGNVRKMREEEASSVTMSANRYKLISQTLVLVND